MTKIKKKKRENEIGKINIYREFNTCFVFSLFEINESLVNFVSLMLLLQDNAFIYAFE